MILFFKKNENINLNNYIITYEIDLSSNNNNENINILYLDFCIVMNISDKNKNYEYIKKISMDFNKEVKEYYKNQQQIIKLLSDKLDYYKKYINSNIILSNYFVIEELYYNTKNLINNEFEIIKEIINDGKKVIYIKEMIDIKKFIEINEFYINFKKNKLKFKTIKTSKPGYLNFTDLEIDFNIERIFTLTDFDDLSENNNKRGIHYNKNFDEIIIINEGRIEFEITNKKNYKIYFNLEKNDILYFPNNYWLCFTILDKKTNITVLCNKTYCDSISSYDFNEFISY